MRRDGRDNSQDGFLSGSDAAFKTDVASISSPLGKIRKLKGVSYKRKKSDKAGFDISETSVTNQSDEEVGENKNSGQKPPQIDSGIKALIEKEKDKRHIGFIAQDVETVVPEVVRTMSDGTKAIAYSQLVALVVEAMKEQQAIIEAQSLKKRNWNKKLMQGKAIQILKGQPVV